MSPGYGHEVHVSKERYLEILGFTSYVYFTGKIGKYSGFFGGKRTLGQFLENFIYGKIAEEAFKEFLKNNYDLESLTDADIADFILGLYLPDIVAFKANETWKPTQFWVEIKEVRRDQRWLLVPASATRQRPYDAYVAVWVGLPDEHIAWLIKNVPEVKEKMGKDWLTKTSDIEEKVEEIPCKICGYALWSDVDAVTQATNGDQEAVSLLNDKFGEEGWYYFDGNTALFDPDDPEWSGSRVGENIGFALRRLEKASDWKEFIRLFRQNQQLIPGVPLRRGRGIRTGLPTKYRSLGDYRTASFRYLQDQLDKIKERFGSIFRETSWFTQELEES